MSPFRFGVGAIAATVLLVAYLGPDSKPDPIVVPTASEAPMVTIKPTPPTSTTTSTTSTTTSTTTTTQPIIGLVGPDTPCQEWLPLMLEEAWPRDKELLETALYIMYRESRCTPNADSGPDHGLFQINRFWISERSNPPYWLADKGIAQTHDDLFDPRTNVRAALAIYYYSLERNGDGFLPWTTYSGG